MKITARQGYTRGYLRKYPRIKKKNTVSNMKQDLNLSGLDEAEQIKIMEYRFGTSIALVKEMILQASEGI